jgi:serine/threonine-protein kinase
MTPDPTATLPHQAGPAHDPTETVSSQVVPVAAADAQAPGGLELIAELGRGGMGVVYRAYDRTLKREVAVKRMAAVADRSPEEMARFHFEAEAAASLDHPNIVPVHAFGEDAGVPFLVMPLMEGGSLSERLNKLGVDRRLPPREAAALVRDIALGVHHAHQRGLLHRDLKPGNILLDRAGRPHVADFGLARQIGDDRGRTATGAVGGTAAYMAPEQARGEKGLTVAADVHALGAILYELLAGSPPFLGPDWLATLKRVQDEPATAVRRARPDVPIDLEAVCLKCLEKRPQDRYPSAAALAEDLTRFLQGEAVGLRRRGLLDTLGRAVGRRREQYALSNWPGFVLGAIVTLVTQGAAEAAALAGLSPRWVFPALTANLVGWWVLYWYFVVLRGEFLNPAEKTSAALKLGGLLAGMALLPSHWGGGWDVMSIYPPLTAVFGLAVFVHGATHWGRMYLAGGLLMVTGAVMPFLPREIWPGLHGAAFGCVTLWFGLTMRGFERQSIAAAERWGGEKSK